MPVERKISFLGIPQLSVSRLVSPNFCEALVSSLLSSDRRHVSVESEDEIRVSDAGLDGHIVHDRNLRGPGITNARIDNAQDGLFGKIFRISYVWKSSQNS